MIIQHDFGFARSTWADEETLCQRQCDCLMVGFGASVGVDADVSYSHAAASLSFTRFFRLRLDEFRLISPTLVLSPLVQDSFDALEIAAHLSHLEFSGRYRAMVMSLPRSEMVRGEMKAAFPAMDFDLIELAGV
jgi:hypothetical protein